MIVIDMDPMPAPRMVRSDKWAKRPVVTRYFAWRQEFVMKCNVAGWKLGPVLKAVFYIAMPDSWSKKKKEQMAFTPHQQRPDADNLTKAVGDAFGIDDGFVHTLDVRKMWAYKGRIELY